MKWEVIISERCQLQINVFWEDPSCCFAAFLCYEKPQEKNMTYVASCRQVIQWAYNLAVNNSTPRLNLLCHSIPPSHKSPPISSCRQSTRFYSRNCNQANNPLFTTQSFSSMIWGFDKGCSNKDWSYLREKDQQHIGWVTDTARARWSSSLACPLSTASVSVSNLFRVICRNKRWTLVLLCFFPYMNSRNLWPFTCAV